MTDSPDELASAPNIPARPSAHPCLTLRSLVVSTLMSLGVVVVLLLVIRLLLPSTIELARYSWHRGQLRAEYEQAGEVLKQVSLDGMTGVSQSVGQRVLPSVVQILNLQNPTPVAGSESKSWSVPSWHLQAATGHGSGVLIDRDGHIVTNSHVLEDESVFYIYLADERIYQGKLIAKDPSTDLALLKIEADSLLPIDWGDSDQMQVGSPVWAVGSPFGLKGSLTFGIVSSKHRLDLSGTYYDDGHGSRPGRGPSGKRGPMARYSDLMQTDVAVNPGNSGGPLVNARGELVGINTAIVGESYRGVIFAIPSNLVKKIVAELRNGGSVRRGWLGVEFVENQIYVERQLSRLATSESDQASTELIQQQSASPERLRPTVQRVLKDSPASQGGLQAGDILVRIDGREISRVEDAIFQIGEFKPGASTLFQVLREGSTVEIPIHLGQRPD